MCVGKTSGCSSGFLVYGCTSGHMGAHVGDQWTWGYDGGASRDERLAESVIDKRKRKKAYRLYQVVLFDI